MLSNQLEFKKSINRRFYFKQKLNNFPKIFFSCYWVSLDYIKQLSKEILFSRPAAEFAIDFFQIK